MSGHALQAVAFLMGGFAAVIVAMFEMALIRGRRRRRRIEAAAAIMPEIRQTLVAYLAGNNDVERLRHFRKTARSELSSAILSYRDSVAGSARDRLCDLTMQVGLLHEWREDMHQRDQRRRREVFSAMAFVSAFEPCRRVTEIILTEALDQPDREARFIAAQALALYGEPAIIPRIFEMATRETLLGRILLAEQLRPHALELCRQALPDALQSQDPERVLGALEIIVAWERALALPGLEIHMEHPQRLIRIAALRAAPLVLPSPELEAGVTRCLADPDAEVAMAAVAAAARLRIQAALPLLARCLRTGDAPLARTAAGALASLPPQGWKTLQEFAGGKEALAASAASEALGRIRTAGAA
jgi:HEAT repeat protein